MNTECMTFHDIANIWLKKESETKAQTTFERIIRCTETVCDLVGDTPITEFQVKFLESLMAQFHELTFDVGFVIAKENVKYILCQRGFTRSVLRNEMGITTCTLSFVYNRKRISKKWALSFADTVGISFDKLFEDHVEQQHFSVASVRLFLKIVRDVLEFAKQQGIIEINPAFEFYAGLPPVKASDPHIPSETDVVRLFDASLHYPDIRVRASMMLHFLFHFNRLQVCELTWKNIDFEQNHITLHDKIVLVPEKIMSILQDYRIWQLHNEKHHNYYIFCKPDGSKVNDGTLKGWFRNVRLRACLDSYSLRDFRYAQYDIFSIEISSIPEIHITGKQQYRQGAFYMEMQSLGMKSRDDYIDYLHFMNAINQHESSRHQKKTC